MQNMIGCQELLKMKIIFFQIKREREREKKLSLLHCYSNININSM